MIAIATSRFYLTDIAAAHVDFLQCCGDATAVDELVEVIIQELVRASGVTVSRILNRL